MLLASTARLWEVMGVFGLGLRVELVVGFSLGAEGKGLEVGVVLFDRLLMD